jgi:hypothetical protein
VSITSTIRVRKGVDHGTFASVGDGAGPGTGVITLPQASVTKVVLVLLHQQDSLR